MKRSRMTSRRTFLKVGASAFAAFPFLRAGAQAVAANDKINLACIGIGNRGGDVIGALTGTGMCNVVALCDTDMGAGHTQGMANRFAQAPKFKDFRQMFDKMADKIDAVSIATPDHSHFPIAMMAMGLGKHVYVEKPMASAFHHMELMMASAKKNKVAAQMGNQGHCGGQYFQFKTWVEEGIIKDVTKVVAHMNGGRRWHKWNGNVAGLPPAQPIPETLDWDTWLAHTPFREYHRDYINGDWRCWFGLGNGAMGDWGAHILDTAHQFLKLGLPTEIRGVKLEGHNDYVFPMASTLSFHFPAREGMPPVDVEWYDGVKNLPEVPENYGLAITDANIPPPGGGSTAVSSLSPGKIIYGDGVAFKGGSHDSMLQLIPSEKAKEVASRLPKIPGGPSNLFKNFLDACRGQGTCLSSFDISGPLCQFMGLGVIAQWLKADKLTFDPVKKRFVGNNRANELLMGPPPRKGWEQFYKV